MKLKRILGKDHHKKLKVKYKNFFYYDNYH